MAEGRDKTGRFLAGERPTGRAKGSVNKCTADNKKRISEFFNKHWEEFDTKIWPSLTPKEQKDTFIALLNYEFPKLSSVDVNTFNKVESSVLNEIRKKIKETSII